MARTFGKAASYIGRKFDLLAMRAPTPVGDALLDQTLFGPEASGEVCTGVQLLAQRWLLHFLTIKGSMQFLPDRGTNFLLEARNGEFRSETDVELSYAVAAAETARALEAEETDDLSDEERYAGDELLAVSVSTETVSITVEITSQAGTRRRVILPIPYLPIRTDLQ